MEQLRGNHHLTMSVGGAQEDHDFHTKALGLRSIKKTVLFDGVAPIHHLYYGNAGGDASSVLTTFPFRQAGVTGRRGTNQVKVIDLAVPAGSLGVWEERLAGHGVTAERTSLVAFDASSPDNQIELELHIEGLGYTDVSDVKDRQYFNSCYVRTPGGPLFELAVSKPESWAIDEPADALGAEFMLPPWLEERRDELMGRLETIETGSETAPR